MKNMRSVFVNQNSVLIEIVICISTNVVTLVDDKNFFVGFGGESFCQDASGKSGAYDKVIKHTLAPFFWLMNQRVLTFCFRGAASFAARYCPMNCWPGSHQRLRAIGVCPADSILFQPP